MDAPRRALKTILVGYERSDAADRVLDRAADLAEAFGARVVVASLGGAGAVTAPVLEPVDPLLVPTAVGPWAPRAPGDVPPSTPEPDEEARGELDQAQARLARRKVQAELVSLEGDPAAKLVELADERDADLIIVGNTEPGFLGRLLGQDVGAAVARRADRDVLLVR
jgi:nucleotide-binding universal stress UspA family protein